MTISTKILFIVPYPLREAPSQRFRFEQYLDFLAKSGCQFSIHSFLPSTSLKVIYKPDNILQKIILLLTGLVTRITTLRRFSQCDFVFIHREATPIGPPVLEWLIAKVLKKKIIYDFDDAIWLTDKVSEGWLEKRLRWRSKVSSICRWSYKVSCGNDYLCTYARQFNKNVVLNPTTIDTEEVHNRALYDVLTHSFSADQEVTIGWTGSHSTLKYLESLESVLQKITDQYPFVSVLVIADRPPQLKLKNLIFKQWTKETEIEDLCRVDIGIMPLPDDEWAKGKCGFKALQYMALCIPALVSPVAVNTTIVTPDVNGFWCKTEQDWMDCLARLIEDDHLRKSMGKEGRKKVEGQYSVISNKENFLSLFQ